MTQDLTAFDKYGKSTENCSTCPRYREKRCEPSHKTFSSLPVDVLFVSDQPDPLSASNNKPFYSRGGRIVQRAIEDLRVRKEFNRINYQVIYAAQCMSLAEETPSKIVLDKCNPLMSSFIIGATPKVIIALGADAAKQLGLKDKHKDMRGKSIPYPNDKSIPVFVTFGERAMVAQPGLYNTFVLDLINAFSIANNTGKVAAPKPTLAELSKDYKIPENIDEAIALCEYIRDYTGDPTVEPSRWPISVDTETTTLKTYKPNAKIIGFCFGWARGKATTILFDHPRATPEWQARLPELKTALANLLAGPKPKIFHNAKFDLKFIEQKYRFHVANVLWDTMLAEHLLDEDKKGNYGLKALTAGFLPQYCGYEDHLYDLLTTEEGVSKIDELDKKIDALEEIEIEKTHPEFLKELKAYRTAYAEFVATRPAYIMAVEEYERKLLNYKEERKIWAQLTKKQRVGKVPPIKPDKPTRVVEPKAPKDPRSKKEQKNDSDAGFENVPIKELCIYGAIDGDVTRQLTSIQNARFKAENSSEIKALMKTHMIPGSRVLGKMEHGGTRVDKDHVEYLEAALTEVVQRTEEELYNMAGRTQPTGAARGEKLNLNHAGTIANVLYFWGWEHPTAGRITHDVTQTTARGQASTADKVLKGLVRYEDEAKVIPTVQSYFIERLLTYKKALKAKNTFLANIRSLSKIDGFLHTSFHLNGTGTGRLSSSDMNLQNLPKFLAGYNIKKLLIPSNPDMLIVNVDYKGAEVRVFTAYAPDKGLIQAMNDGMDMHSFFANKVFGRPYEDYENRGSPEKLPDLAYRKLLDEERSNIKRVVFGILYGAGAGKIAETIGIDQGRAQELIDLLFKMFPEIKKYLDRTHLEVDKHRFVKTYFERRRRFPLANISMYRNRARRQADNFKIQSTSSDIVLGQLVEVDEHIGELGGRMLLTVHDSMVMEIPKANIYQVKDFITHYAEKRVRDKYDWLPVPFKCDIEVGPSYGECKPIDKYIADLPHKYIPEGIVEEEEILDDLREHVFEEVAA